MIMAKKLKIYWEDYFEKLDELGEGGNAKVFRVKDKLTGKECALKSLENRGKEKVARFNDEIKIISENAVSIGGMIPIIKATKEEYWYTMPIAIPITKYIDEKQLGYEYIIKGVIQLAETLSMLHKKGIAHRDIKPSNIYYYRDGFAFGDFGLVEFPDNPNDFTRSDRGLGAIFTIAPEMKRDPKHADGKKADVFSLAKTAWMFLTGDEKGFDGTYNFLDKSISLRFNPKFKAVHLVELEEVLTKATDNNPDNRPTINEFKKQLEIWLEVIDDFEKSQLSSWGFLNKYLFGVNAPESSKWTNRESIINILNTIGTIPVYNHMLLSDRGGLDFGRAEVANEEGCIYIYDTIGFCFLVKPKCLCYEGFEGDFRWNYFLLELDNLEPVFKENDVVSYEYLVEDYPSHYVSAKYEQYGVYDYDSGEKLPEGWKSVRRYLKGKFLIVLKSGPYNKITSTYDGRHGMCSNLQFRSYIESMMEFIDKMVQLGENEYTVLNSKPLRENPFCEEVEEKYYPETTESKSAKQFIIDNHNQWCFKELLAENEAKSNIRFYISYKVRDGSIFSILSEEIEYLCKDGYIKKLESDQKEEIYYFYDRSEAIKVFENCNKLMQDICEKEQLMLPEFESFISLNFERCGKPKHIFTKGEICELMRNADDRIDNMLVIDEDGYAKIIQNIEDGYLYPVSHESWNAGNVYVGKYSKLGSLEEDYISSLQGWLIYLESNKHYTMDYVHDNQDVDELLKEIEKYY